MFRIAGAIGLALIAGTLSARLVEAQEIGDPIVVLRDTPIKRGKEVLQILHAGELLRVEDVKDDWFWISSEATGWVSARNVAAPKEAVEYFSASLGENAEDVEALVARGKSQLADRRPDKALADFDEALGINPEHTGALIGRAHALADKHLAEKALTALNRALSLDPQLVDALFLRGVILAESGRLGQGAADLSQCLGISPDHAPAFRARAGVWLELHDLERALADADQATELDPRSSTAFVTRASALLAAGKRKEGLADLNEAVRLDPSDRHALLARGHARLQKQEFRQADADFSAALEIETDSQVLTLRGDVRMEMKDFDRAIADYSAALKLKRDDPHALHSRSTARMCKHDYAQALADVTELVRIDPNDVTARWRRAFIRAAAPNAALRDGKQAVADAVFACDRTQWKQAEPVSVLAAGYAELGDFDKAVEWETKAIKLTIDKGLQTELAATLKLYQQHKPFRLGNSETGVVQTSAQTDSDPHGESDRSMSHTIAIPPDRSLPQTTREGDTVSLATSHERFRYLPCLDGLRAISILLVLAFHGMGPISIHIARACSGWVGVDIFFVISGFLITSILEQERADFGSFSLSRFYTRRCLRIWPAYYVFLLVLGLTAYSHWKSIGISSIYLTNFDLALGWNVLELRIGHLWSLAVEEQFYLLWPIALLVAGRRALAMALSLIAGVWIWRTILFVNGASWLRLCAGLDTRLDAILLGCVVAMIWARPDLRAKIRRALSGKWTPIFLVLAMVAAAAALGHPSEGQTLPAKLLLWDVNLPLFTLFTAALILSLLVHPASRVTRFLSHPLLVWLGRVSYSLYLWHVVVFKIWPTMEIAFLRNAFPGSPMFCYLLANIPNEAGRLLLSVAFASASFYFIERPFLSLKKRWESDRPPSEQTATLALPERPAGELMRKRAA